MTTTRPYRFIISGGGTGGHIYPALAVANEIKRRHTDAELLFVGAKGRMEMSKVPEAGYKIIGLRISGFQRRLSIQNLYFPFKVLHSLLAAKKIVKNFKPDAVLGFGGYASAPVMMAANGKSLPALLQEQNSYAGLTNRKVAKKARTICVAYEGMDKYFGSDKRIVLTGNPVRSDILDVDDKREQALKHFGLDPYKKVILVLGGSLGARTLNDSVVNNLQNVIQADVQMIWQCGKFYYQEMQNRSADMDMTSIRLVEFIKEMDLAYAAADVIVSRAGALSISELCLVGKPVIFVPSPNVAEDHQTKNAKALTARDAAVLVPDDEAPDKMIEAALDLLKDDTKKQKLAENIKKLARPRATEDIVEELLKIVS